MSKNVAKNILLRYNQVEKLIKGGKNMEEKKKETKVEEKKVETPKTEVKKFEATKSNDKKSNNSTIIIGVVAAIIAVIAIIIAITFGNNSPKKVVESNLKDLKTGVFAEQMLSGLMQGEDNLNVEAGKLLFEKLEWKILSEKEEGNQATVELEITNKDFKTIVGNYMQKALKVALTGQKVSQEEMTNYLIEELNNEEIPTTTVNQTITLEKQNGRWAITDKESLANVALPGLYEAMEAFR